MAQLSDDVTQLLKDQPVFAPLDEAELDRLAEACELATYPMGTTICEEGAEGDAAYLVVSGRVRVTRRVDGGSPRTLAILGRGDLVGERAILAAEPRNATVRTAEDTVLARLGRDTFAAFCRDHPDLAPYFEALAREQALISFMRMNRLGQALPPRSIRDAVRLFEPVSFEAGQTICREGEPGDRMYVVRRGQVKVIRESDNGGNGHSHPLAVLGEGEYFGERSLLLGESRAATVYAVHDTDCLALKHDDLERLMQEAPKLRGELRARIAEYDRQPTAPPAPSPAPSTEGEASRAVEPPPGPAEAQEPQTETASSTPRPRRGPLGRYPWLRQHDERDCGAACLAMAARLYGKRLPIARLRELSGADTRGASLFGLARAGEHIGFRTRALQLTYNELADLELPAVAHWDGFHYVIVYEANAQRAVIGDPARGIMKMSRDEFERHWTGHLLQLTPTPELLEQEEQRASARRFLPMLKPYTGLLFEVLLAALIVSVLGLATPVFTQMVIDEVLVHQDLDLLNLLLIGMIFVGVFSAIALVLRQYLLVHVSQKLRLQMSSDLFRKILTLPMAYFARRTTGDILTRFRDNAEVQQLLTSNAIVTLLNVVMVLVYFAMLFWYSVTLTGVAALFVLAAIALVAVLSPIMKRNNQRVFERTATTQSRLIEAVRHIDAIKSRAAELPTRWRYENALVDEANQQFKSAALGMQMTAGTHTIQLFATVAVLFFGARLVLDGQLSIGQLIAFNTLFGMMLSPVLELAGMWQKFQDALLSLQRLSDIYDADPEEPAGAAALSPMPRIRGRIQLESVWFQYGSDGAHVLRNISLEIEPGETVALIGRSGSGKTTLISLLQRFYQPTSGRILIDGTDLAGVSAASLRPQIGAVLQDPAMLTGTIRDNIALGDPEASMDRVVEAARLAHAHDFITGFPTGYETKIGEVGVQLSGGQRQRLAIARALLAEPRILIFDEATSALDTESERAIQRNMGSILADRTAIVIAHRLSTIQHADRIVVLDEGMIAEQGTHDELIERRGLYYYLRSQQMGT